MSDEINWNKYYYNINTAFFKTWTPEMAYILGFACSDGNVYKTSLTWDLTDIHLSNKKLLEKINQALQSNYPIKKRKNSYRLRISNHVIVADIIQLGITPAKSKTICFPEVLPKFASHFLRGVLDGDGWISVRTKNKRKEISVGFCSGSRLFIENLNKYLEKELEIKHFNLRVKKKVTTKGKLSIVYSSEFYSENAYKILNHLYHDSTIELDRKFKKYLRAKKLYEDLISRNGKSKLWIKIEKRYNRPLDMLLQEMLTVRNMSPPNIARELKISLAHVYRWLEKTNVRTPQKRN